MPRKGYKCITVTEKVHEDLKKRAIESNLTMKEYLEHLLIKDKDTKKENKSAH